jgi:hypothetical protein
MVGEDNPEVEYHTSECIVVDRFEDYLDEETDRPSDRCSYGVRTVEDSVVSDRCNISPRVIDQHYDGRDEARKMEQRRRHLPVDD